MDESIIPETLLPEVDIEAMLDGIKAAISAKFPTLKTVEDYARVQEEIETPAVFFEITGIESDGTGDIGTEQFSATITLSAYCVVDFKTREGQKAQRRAASLAGSVAAFIKGQTWGVPVQLAREINACPDYFHGKGHKLPDEYQCYRVDWQHFAILGKSVWDESEAPRLQEVILNGNSINPPIFTVTDETGALWKLVAQGGILGVARAPVDAQNTPILSIPDNAGGAYKLSVDGGFLAIQKL